MRPNKAEIAVRDCLTARMIGSCTCARRWPELGASVVMNQRGSVVSFTFGLISLASLTTLR